MPLAATTSPPIAGPANQQALSIADAVTLDAVSSFGERASVGRSAESAGRKAEPATAKTSDERDHERRRPVCGVDRRRDDEAHGPRRVGEQEHAPPPETVGDDAREGRGDRDRGEPQRSDDPDGRRAAVVVGVEGDDDPVRPAAELSEEAGHLEPAEVGAREDGTDRREGAARSLGSGAHGRRDYGRTKRGGTACAVPLRCSLGERWY